VNSHNKYLMEKSTE